MKLVHAEIELKLERNNTALLRRWGVLPPDKRAEIVLRFVPIKPVSLTLEKDLPEDEVHAKTIKELELQSGQVNNNLMPFITLGTLARTKEKVLRAQGNRIADKTIAMIGQILTEHGITYDYELPIGPKELEVIFATPPAELGEAGRMLSDYFLTIKSVTEVTEKMLLEKFEHHLARHNIRHKSATTFTREIINHLAVFNLTLRK